MSDKKISSASSDISLKTVTQKKPLNASALTNLPKDVKKRWLYVGTGLAIAIAAATTLSQKGSPSAPTAMGNAPEQLVDTTPKGLSTQQDWRTQTSAELNIVKQSLSESQASQKELLARLETMRQEISTLKTNESDGRRPAEPALTTGRIDFNLPPPPTAPNLGNPLTPAGSKEVVGVTPRALPNPTSFGAPPTDYTNGTALSSPGSSFGGSMPPPIKRTPAKGFIPDGAGADAGLDNNNKETTIKKMVPNEKQGFLPAGSFAAATLISGVEAFTGGTAQSQPQPIVIRLDENAILPNNAGYKIKGCHLLASVYGDMSSERVFGRTSTLTCVDINDKLVLSEEVEGNIIDSDGKNGIRGVLQDRQGAKLARSLLAGFAKGMADAFGDAESTSLADAGSVSKVLTGSSIKAAGYSGASKATEQLAEFYLKQAEATMPIIAVDAGRKISVLFTKSKSLKFESVETYKTSQEATLHVEVPKK